MNGPLPVQEGFLTFRGHNVWYRIVGETDKAGKIPLIGLHGGPGATHDYLAPLQELAATGRRVVLYDQLGWGNSDHPRDPSMWTTDLFVAELAAVRRALHLDRAHVFGHSWGGMLALEYALTQPAGLAGLILASTTASARQWKDEANRLIAALPGEVQRAIRQHESMGTTDAPEYQEACRVFSRHHLSGHVEPKPEWFQKALAKLEDNEVYLTMWGPSEFCFTGTLKDWDVSSRLGAIRVPTLILAGRFDEATPAMAKTLHRGISGSECEIFEKSAHFFFVEETQRFLEVLEGFLNSVEARAV